MNLIITGYITAIFPTETFGENFRVRKFWVEEPGIEKYKNHFELQCQQSGVALLDKFRAGDLVECQVDLGGRKSSKGGRDYVFNSLKVWKVARVAEQPHPEPQPDRSFDEREAMQPGVIDDLPF